MPAARDPFSTIDVRVQARAEKRIDRVVDASIIALAPLAFVAAIVVAYVYEDPTTVAVRIHAGPLDSVSSSAWHVTVLSYRDNLFSPLPNLPLLLYLQDQMLEGVTDSAGVWEASIAPSKGGSATVSISIVNQATNETILNKRLVNPSWKLHPYTVSMPCKASGVLAVSIVPERSLWATGFAEYVKIQLGCPLVDSSKVVDTAGKNEFSHSSCTPRNCSLRLESDALTWTPDPPPVVHDGAATLQVLPRFGLGTLRVDATCPSGFTGTVTCELAAVDGLMWVDPDALSRSQLSVHAPVGYERAYVAVVSEKTRIAAWSMDLVRDSKGGAHGAMRLSTYGPSGLDKWICVSPDPPSSQQEQLAWPMPDQNDRKTARKGDTWPLAARKFTTPLIVDTTEQAKAAVRQYRKQKRPLPSALLAIAALVEAGLLGFRVRRVQGTNAGHREDASLSMHRGVRWWGSLVLASVVIALGFGLLALLLWMRA